MILSVMISSNDGENFTFLILGLICIRVEDITSRVTKGRP